MTATNFVAIIAEYQAKFAMLSANLMQPPNFWESNVMSGGPAVGDGIGGVVPAIEPGVGGGGGDSKTGVRG